MEEGTLRIIRCNNMGWEIERGNKDGHGSFALVHASKERFDLSGIDHIARFGDRNVFLKQADRMTQAHELDRRFFSTTKSKRDAELG